MASQSDELIVARRFRGPPGSGNGGYVAGLLAEWIDGAAEVTLHAPIPLDVPLHRRREGDTVSLADATTLYARARPMPGLLDLDVPAPPRDEEVEAAAVNFPGPAGHPIPGCFVCGTDRTPGDGLCIYAGESPHRDVALADWTPGDDLAGVEGHVATPFLWAALDCPSYFGLLAPRPLALLARMEGRIARPVMSGERLMVTGWSLGSEGRKHRAAAALHDQAGELVALARALWISVDRVPA